VAAVFVLRRRPGYDTSFRVPGYPIVPLIFIASTVALLLNALIDKSSRTATLGVFLGILLGIPVYAFITRRMGSSGGSSRDESVALNS
jgi:APA family basic amino acid/polyamine antiporter